VHDVRVFFAQERCARCTDITPANEGNGFNWLTNRAASSQWWSSVISNLYTVSQKSLYGVYYFLEV